MGNKTPNLGGGNDANCLSINQFHSRVSLSPPLSALTLTFPGHRNHCSPMCSISTMISDAIIDVIRYRTTQPTIGRFIGRAKTEVSARWVASADPASVVDFTRPFPIHASVHQQNMN